MHQHVKNQLNLQIHSCNTLNFRLHDLEGATHTFDHAQPIIFSYPEIVPSFKKSA